MVFNKKRLLFFKFLVIVVVFFLYTTSFSCLYNIEKTSLESNDFDTIIKKLKDNENSLVYPDKSLIKLMQAIFLERKGDYKQAFDIYVNLLDSEYQIYAKNRTEILQKFYINPPKIENKTGKQEEETIFTKFEKNLISFLSDENIKQFYNLFYSIIFPINKKNDQQIVLSNDLSNENKDKSEGQNDLNLILLAKTLDKIKNDEKIQQNIKLLLDQTETILIQNNLAYMTKSKIFYYQFFLYLFIKNDDEKMAQKKADSLYLSFFNGGLYYYQLLSYCIINAIANNEMLQKILNVNFITLDLNSFFDLSQDPKKDFFNLIKEKKDIRNNLKISFSKSKLKKTEYNQDRIKKHIFLANYFLENNLNLEFSRAIFYLRDLTQNYKIYNSLLVDLYNLLNQYDRAIYYQWDTILTDYFPIYIFDDNKNSYSANIKISNNNKIPSSYLSCIFPLWFLDIINQNIDKFKDQFDPKVTEDSILLDPYFYLSIINAESSFSKDITSSANAIGLMQLLPSTAAWVRNSTKTEAQQNLIDPYYNIESGFYYIKYLSKTFNGNVISILGAYNGGHNAFSKKKTSSIHPLLVAEIYPVSETAIYIKKIIRNYIFYRLIYENKSIEDTFKKIIISSIM